MRFYILTSGHYIYIIMKKKNSKKKITNSTDHKERYNFHRILICFFIFINKTIYYLSKVFGN